MFISNLQIIAFITTEKYLSRRRADRNRYQHDRRANKNSIGTTVVRILTSLNNIGF